jgi:hypothetical protein
MALSDHEEAVFAELMGRVTLRGAGKGSHIRAGIGVFVLGLVGLLATFTWSVFLGLLCVLVMGAGAWLALRSWRDYHTMHSGAKAPLSSRERPRR